MKRTRKRKRVAKKKTTRKRSRVVVRTQKKKTTKRKRPPPKKKRKRRPRRTAEFSVNVSYRKGSRFQTNAISFQMSAIGPENASKDDVINVITDVLQSEGEDVKKGWTVRIVSWRDGQVPKHVPWDSLAIVSGEPATRFSVERSGGD